MSDTPTSESLATYWSEYLATLPDNHPHHNAPRDAYGFGDSPQMADELGQLVVAGTKAATAGLLKAYEIENEPLPTVGGLTIILDGRDQPMCIVETTEVTIKPFSQADAQFAYDEGEGDRTLTWWQQAHEAFFRRECASLGIDYHDDMQVVFERFRLIYTYTPKDES